MDGSYHSTLPFETRCSPWKKPLSEVKRMKVLSSSPAWRRVSTIDAIASSTDISVSRRCCQFSWIAATCRALSSGRCLIARGLSDTSASLKLGGCGSGVPFSAS